MSQQTDKVVEQLLGEVYSGHINTQLSQRLVISDSDDNTLFISRIAPHPATPATVLEELFGLKSVSPKGNRPTLPDVMENVIGQQYRRGNQMQTASYLDQGICLKYKTS